jgi:hypothetical protein
MPSGYPGWEWWVWSIFSIAALILGIIAIADTNTVYNVRCFQTSGNDLAPVPGGYTGMVIGCMEFGVSRLQVNLQWWMPTTQGIPSAIIIRGPLINGGVGPLPIANPALTICGANNTNTCAALESITCDEYEVSPGCGKLEVSITDLAPTDFPLTSQLPAIAGFLSQAKTYPQLFYVSIEHAGIETARGPVLQLGRVN